jgi:protein-S-isoprenylcysteine O-methyltransferase Ste14
VGSWEAFSLRSLHPLLWLTWLAYWLISAANNKTTVRRESLGQRWPYVLLIWLGMVLFIRPSIAPHLARHIWTPSFAMYGLGTALLVAGLLFTVWARVVLGRNWSGIVTVKQDHELIQSGPYRWVRHPIYTGLLVAFAGSATAQDLWTSVLAVVLFFVSFWLKLLREEAWMRETFGDAYRDYCARTSRLIPGIL